MKATAVLVSLGLTMLVSVALIALFGLARPAAERSCPLRVSSTSIATTTGFAVTGNPIYVVPVQTFATTVQTVTTKGHTGPGGTGPCAPPPGVAAGDGR